MRARQPDLHGSIEYAGVSIAYEVHGTAGPAVVMLPAWMVVESRAWKLQVPYLARHFRVVTFDPPGNGLSDRPVEPEPYDLDANVEYTRRVMDAAGVEDAVLVGFSQGGELALAFAASYPERVNGCVLIGSAAPVSDVRSARRRAIEAHFDDPAPEIGASRVALGIPDPIDEWSRYNRDYWLRDLEDFAWFFFGQAFPEPHSTKQIEDCVDWTMQTTGQAVGAESDGSVADAATYRSWAENLASPLLLLHGSEDRIIPLSRSEEVAALTGQPLVVLEGSGHLPHARDPVRVNLLIRDFVDRVAHEVPA